MKRGLNLSKTKNSGNPGLWDPGCIKNLQKLLGLEFQRRSFWAFFPRGFLKVFSVGYIRPRSTNQTKKINKAAETREKSQKSI